ncbi:MAG: 3-hydroxyacyl-CoA dehydrogenase family protein [Bacteroidia bacterium]|nr:3-hydroxyacyl-CoA dehydrogenase family protein [Bacteroidia bacterium]MCX7652025.1 3-hydroxyacyl-CoA dehydrogenase family protein [Bacteroidia bacterium]MDW8416304.1 3-hydroxyacyl-CoA dehydrogenase family protein [Bacteroidia bacterium]
MEVLILGAGTMGKGIAEVFAGHKIAVTLYEPDPAACERATPVIEKYAGNLSLMRELPQSLPHDIVIEAVPEDLALKRQVLADVSERLSPESIVATNTSALSVTLLAQATKCKTHFLGWHFFNPAPRMPLVEVIPTVLTAQTVVEKSVRLLQSVGKVPIVAPDLPGFIVNRVARPYYVEALRLVERGDISPEVIDQLMEGLGFRMGPFRLMDLIGIDVNHAVTQRVWEGLFYPARFRPSWLQAQKIAAGQTGRKAGHGFYEYEAQKRL